MNQTSQQTFCRHRLRDLRRQLGLSQEEAARRVRVSRRAWCDWEYGRHVPTPSHQLLLSLLLEEKRI